MNWLRKLIVGDISHEIQQGVLKTLETLKANESKAMLALNAEQRVECRELFPKVAYISDVQVISYIMKKADESRYVKTDKYKKAKKK